jgi:hypothetical protein
MAVSILQNQLESDERRHRHRSQARSLLRHAKSPLNLCSDWLEHIPLNLDRNALLAVRP